MSLRKVYHDGKYVGLVDPRDMVLIECLGKLGYEIEGKREKSSRGIASARKLRRLQFSNGVI